MTKYRIQLGYKSTGRLKWRGAEAIEVDTDREAAIYAVEHYAKHNTPVRVLDGTDSVIVVFTPNWSKF